MMQTENINEEEQTRSEKWMELNGIGPKWNISERKLF